MDDIVLEWNHQVHYGAMTIVNYIWNCGLHYGYNLCCIKNYINLCLLGLAPAMFMSVVLDHDNKANHVLCPMCNDNWIGDRARPRYDMSRPDAVEKMKSYKQMKNNL